jgi:hypothetical protein
MDHCLQLCIIRDIGEFSRMGVEGCVAVVVYDRQCKNQREGIGKDVDTRIDLPHGFSSSSDNYYISKLWRFVL